MNKFVLLLGVIIIAILAMMFFCVGFFTGTTITTSDVASVVQGSDAAGKIEEVVGAAGANSESIADKLAADKTTIRKIVDAVDAHAKSLSISDKVMKILAAAGYATETFSNVVKGKSIPVKKRIKVRPNEKITVDALLREMFAEHRIDDECSLETTKRIIEEANVELSNVEEIKARKIVFIGYFKDNVAIQIQKLLSAKGYKVHVEHSKVWNSDESFVFCGPFEKEQTAVRLESWLKEHDFSDARIIDVIKGDREGELLDSISENSENMPENDENISEGTAETAGTPATASTTTQIASTAQVAPITASTTAPTAAQQAQAINETPVIGITPGTSTTNQQQTINVPGM